MTTLQVHQISDLDLKQLVVEAVAEGLSKIKPFEKKAYSKKEFANLIGKSTSFVDQERRAGRLEWKLNGGTVSIPATELKKYI